VALFELRGVSLGRGGRTVLDRVSAKVPVGTTAVVGPSGSGKSTLLRLLNRLADPDSGEIAYRGRPLTALDPLELRREVSLVPQLPALLPGTAADNLAYAARLAGGQMSADLSVCLRHAGLDASYAVRNVEELSVGERQRVMLARSLVQQPQVLLLDEPTSALDETARDAVEQTLERLREDLGISQVLVTHDPAQARRVGDWVVRLEGGRVRDCGAPEKVLA
jgi:putative ABC transport system ATP-binding protein